MAPEAPGPFRARNLAGAPCEFPQFTDISLDKSSDDGNLSTRATQPDTNLRQVGYRRPLELNDIWQVNPNRATPLLAEKLRASFDDRVQRGAKRPLIGAMIETFKVDFYTGAVCALIANLAQVFVPYVLKYLIAFAAEAWIADKVGSASPPIARGIGWVFAICGIQILASIGNNHFMYRGMVVGGEVRSALISVIFRKAFTITKGKKPDWKPPLGPPAEIQPGSKQERKWYAKQLKKQNGKKKKDVGQDGWTNGRIINLMSTDTYRIDQASGWFHMVWASPTAILVTMALLLINLTYSALPGIALFFVAVPILSMMVRRLFARRRTINQLTDRRVSRTQEVLQAIRFVKYYAWEGDFLKRIGAIRRREIRSIQMLLVTRNAINAFGMSIPIFAAMLAFVTYSLTNHGLNPAAIFSSLSLFNQLRLPLTILPMVVGLVTDAIASINRIQQFLLAEDKVDTIELLDDFPDAINLSDAAFTWEEAMVTETDEAAMGRLSKKNAKQQKRNAKIEEKRAKKLGEPQKKVKQEVEVVGPQVGTTSDSTDGAEPFKITGINLSIGRNEFIGVAGGVGSGKSSLLAALAGDMRQVGGRAIIGGSKAYCPQSAWIQNATVLDNITFGKDLDEARFSQVVDACSLRHDLDILPGGRLTEIGERGINLSGGQKQRVNLARAIYSEAQIMLMDDPLSAVDAHVGSHILEHAICGDLLRDKCRILATHQLHALHRCDRIIIMKDGQVSAFDTFDNLMAKNEEFRSMMSAVDIDRHDNNVETGRESTKSALEETGGKPEESLMQEEERGSDNVSPRVYYNYFKAAGSGLTLPLLFLLLAISQGATIASGLWLAWWTSNKFGFSTAKYVSRRNHALEFI